jgi:hypothetical protein
LGSATEDGSNDQQKMPLGWQYGGFMRDKHDLDEMMQSLSEAVHGKRTIPRRRFDFVVGNPPYISYNECAKAGVKIFQLLKENNSGVNLNNIYGWNLHSVPTNRKKYSPKPNLYAFFIALGVALLKKNGRLCYIIPQTMLVNSDFDVLRYCLAKNTTLEKFFIFKSKMFIGRGLEQKRFIPTSSLIIVIHNQTPAADNVVDVCTYLNENDDINTCLVNMTARNPDAVLMQQVPQKKLLANLANWNFLGKEEGFLDLYEAYKANSDGMAVYFEHKMSEPKFGSRFYFDKGLVFPKDAIRDAEAKQKDEFALVKLKKLFYNAEVLERYVNEKSIRIPQGSQGLDVYRCRYKVIWSYMNWDQFYFCDKQIVIGYNFVIISSDNREELLYLLSILNSSVSKVIIHTLLKIANEDKLTLLLGIKQIKEHIRAPRITDQNKHFKNKVIKLTEQMLEMEKQTIADLVEPDTLMQHFNDVRVEGFNLVLKSGSKEVRAAIKRGAVKLVEKALDAHFGSQKLLPGERAIALAELKALPAFDKDGQMKIKEEIDELVFDLYGLTKTELQHFSTL